MSALMLAALFLAGSFAVSGAIRNLQDGYFLQRGGLIIRRKERPFAFWIPTALMLIVGLVFIGESFGMMLYLLFR